MQQESRQLAASGKRIGLVPTMGYLHEGHLSLIRRARKLSDVVVTSIFVNPSQFAPHEDFARYPRDETGDIGKIRSAGGAIAYVPKAASMYAKDFQTWVEVEKLTQPLEGKIRPGHFRGVATVVAKLFNAVRPDVVVFGEKDFQQVAVLRRMTADLDYPITFVVAPTIRERDGLAMSSRNSYLTPLARTEALGLYRSLRTARAMVQAGILDCRKIEREMRTVILATCRSAVIDYIAFNHRHTLEPVRRVAAQTVCSMAVRVHGVRLIDNMRLK